jgi:uncharacterized protein (DUF58 family)
MAAVSVLNGSASGNGSHTSGSSGARVGAAAALSPESLLRRIDWHIIRRLDGALQGDFRTYLPGVGVDFMDLREYEPGDDVRHIDWNVTARMDTPYVRTYHEDRELTAWFLIDRTASMTFGPVDRPKEVVAAELVTTLARLLTRGGNRVGALLYDNRARQTIQPMTGRNQVLRLAHELLQPTEPAEPPKLTSRSLRRRKPATDAVGGPNSTNLADLVTAGSALVRRRSLVILVSDFISAPGWEQPLSKLTQRHEVVAIRLVDPREYELPTSGVLVLEDTETGEQLVVDTNNPGFRSRLLAGAQAQEETIKSTTQRIGVDLHTMSTTEDLVGALIRLAERRRRSGRRA